MPASAAAPMCDGPAPSGGGRPASLSRFSARGLSLLLGGALILWGCARSPAADSETVESSAVGHAVPEGVAQLPNLDLLADTTVDPREFSIEEINDGPATQQLGAAKLLHDNGVMDLLDSYIINIPHSAESIVRWDLTKSWVANAYHNDGAEPAQQAVGNFENRILSSALDALDLLAQRMGSQRLHDAFFGVLEACGRASAWPEAELFVMGDGCGYDVEPHLIEPTFGLTYFEYQQLRHQCARYAATYPTLDPAARDRLLAPQRGHYAQVILDSLDNELPLVEIPAEYRDEIDDLRVNGW
ncbi:MAG: hypothetical protein F4003_08845 [Acidimicrobiaceae bacterium]|nr:hypothetical protein [Acidimicrobiaceae bacterium]